MGPELLKILRTWPGTETADKVGSQFLEVRTVNLERDARSQMLKAADVSEETCSCRHRLGHTLADGFEPLAGEVVEDGDMRLQKIASGRKVLLSEAIERFDIIGLDMSGYDHRR